MTWRNNLRPAKLGKASFQVDSADGQFVRNVQVHEYPLRDKPYVEDLGRKARRITLECYVLADIANKYDYMPERDALIAELESAGTKTLVHPYLGALKVNVVDGELQIDAELPPEPVHPVQGTKLLVNGGDHSRMQVVGLTMERDEYGAVTSWTLELEEV